MSDSKEASKGEGKTMHAMLPIMLITSLLGGGAMMYERRDWFSPQERQEHREEARADYLAPFAERDQRWREHDYWRRHWRWNRAEQYRDRAEIYEGEPRAAYGAPPGAYPRQFPADYQRMRPYIPCGIYAWKPCTRAVFVTKDRGDYAPRAIWRSTNPRLLYRVAPGPYGWGIQEERELRSAYDYYSRR